MLEPKRNPASSEPQPARREPLRHEEAGGRNPRL